MTFTLADLLRMGTERNQQDEPETHGADHIRKSTSEAQRARMAKAREAKAQKQAERSAEPPPEPRKAQRTASKSADTVKLPEDADYRRLYLTLLLLANQQKAEGFGPVVPHWKVMSELKGSEPFEQSPRIMLQDLESDGFVRQIITRKGGALCWIPVALDDTSNVRNARSERGARSSNIGRQVEALEAEYLKNARK